MLQEHGGGPEGAVHPGRLPDHRGVPHQAAGNRELQEQRHRHRLAGPPHSRESTGTVWGRVREYWIYSFNFHVPVED